MDSLILVALKLGPKAITMADRDGIQAHLGHKKQKQGWVPVECSLKTQTQTRSSLSYLGKGGGFWPAIAPSGQPKPTFVMCFAGALKLRLNGEGLFHQNGIHLAQP